MPGYYLYRKVHAISILLLCVTGCCGGDIGELHCGHSHSNVVQTTDCGGADLDGSGRVDGYDLAMAGSAEVTKLVEAHFGEVCSEDRH